MDLAVSTSAMIRLPCFSGLFILAIAMLPLGTCVAQRAFNDSLAVISGRIATQLVDAGKPRVALAGIGDPGGVLDPGLVTYVEELLVMHLTMADRKLVVVERRGLDQVVEEQRRAANGTFDEDSAIELGRLLAADAIVTGNLYHVDKRLHLIVRMLDTATGILIGSAETTTEYPKGKEPGRTSASQSEPLPQVPATQGAPASAGHMEFRAIAMGANHFERNTWGAAMEASFRSAGDGARKRGKASLGLQLAYWPDMGSWTRMPFDVGVVNELRVFETNVTDPTVRLGNIDLRQGDLFLIDRGEVPLSYQARTGNVLSGLDLLEWQRFRISNMQTSKFGFDLPLRLYLGSGTFGLPRLYVATGFGMDFLFVKADYEVSSTLVQYDLVEGEYRASSSTYMDSKPMGGTISRDLYFSHWTLGGGIEVGRLHLFVQGRFLISTRLNEMGRGYDRVRGNILALPALWGADGDARTLAELGRDEVVRYGAMDMESVLDADESGQGRTITANGVSRFWDEQYLMLGISFRFL